MIDIHNESIPWAGEGATEGPGSGVTAVTPISRHSPTLHDGANVDATISPLIALAHNRDAQEIVLFCGGKPGDEGKHQLHAPQGPWRPDPPGPSIPMLSVTVMMLRDIVESVTLLKDEACGGQRGRSGTASNTPGQATGFPGLGPSRSRPEPPTSPREVQLTHKQPLTLSRRGGRCFLRRRWRLRRREALLCSVELLNLLGGWAVVMVPKERTGRGASALGRSEEPHLGAPQVHSHRRAMYLMHFPGPSYLGSVLC